MPERREIQLLRHPLYWGDRFDGYPWGHTGSQHTTGEATNPGTPVANNDVHVNQQFESSEDEV
jgi:hypothetical protein